MKSLAWTPSIVGTALFTTLVVSGCASQDTENGIAGLPPRNAEEQAAALNMEKNTLAEIELPDGKMRFVEIEPGSVMVMRQFPIDTPAQRFEGEATMALDQLYRAYAPGKEIPGPLLDAMARLGKPVSTEAVAPSGPTVPMEQSAGRPSPVATKDSPIENSTAALASTINMTWFTQNYCGFKNTDYSWCYTVAYQGAFGKKTSHRTNSITCGDTGAARTNFSVSGTIRTTLDVPYGQCWTMGSYHGPHGFLGVNLERSLRHEVVYAQQSVRFSGWFADEDQFIAAF